MKLLAPAKINIGLHVIRKRSDKYHDIETIFYPIHLADEVEIIKSDKHEFYSNIPLDADANLCLRSLHFFCERTGINAEVKIILKKNIPIGGGLGGGSSDAAAVLLALQELYGNPLSEIELHDIAVQLGADVPFFMSRRSQRSPSAEGRRLSRRDPFGDSSSISFREENPFGKKIPAYATGKGEIIEPIALHVASFILTVTPAISVSTALAYSMVAPTGVKSKSLRDSLFELGTDYGAYKESVVNDFELEVIKKFPVIGEIKTEMYNLGAQFALMSGSGSSVYGFFENESLAKKTSEILNRKFALRTADITSPQTVI